MEMNNPLVSFQFRPSNNCLESWSSYKFWFLQPLFPPKTFICSMILYACFLKAYSIFVKPFFHLYNPYTIYLLNTWLELGQMWKTNEMDVVNNLLHEVCHTTVTEKGKWQRVKQHFIICECSATVLQKISIHVTLFCHKTGLCYLHTDK